METTQCPATDVILISSKKEQNYVIYSNLNRTRVNCSEWSVRKKDIMVSLIYET